jgi:hypothetical protein
MALSPTAIAEVDSILEGTSRKIWHLPNTFPRAGLHAPTEELGLSIPTIWEDYCGSAIRSWTQILNDEGALGVTARASYVQAAETFKH